MRPIFLLTMCKVPYVKLARSSQGSPELRLGCCPEPSSNLHYTSIPTSSLSPRSLFHHLRLIILPRSASSPPSFSCIISIRSESISHRRSFSLLIRDRTVFIFIESKRASALGTRVRSSHSRVVHRCVTAPNVVTERGEGRESDRGRSSLARMCLKGLRHRPVIGHPDTFTSLPLLTQSSDLPPLPEKSLTKQL